MEEIKSTEKVDEGQPVGPSRFLKLVTTCVIFYGNISYACSINSFGPALTDFKNKYDTDTSAISVVFSAAVGCYLVGALLSTVIFSFMNRQFVVVVLFAGMATSMLIAPHVPTLLGFYFVGGFLGLCIGCYDTAQIVWVMEMWQDESGPFIQAQHFCYAVGTVLAPVIMSPFLKNKYDDEDDEGEGDTEKNDRLFVPYTIIGCLCALAGVTQLVLFIFLRYTPPPRSKASSASIDDMNNNGGKNSKLLQWPGWPTARLVILSCLSLGFYQGMEMCTMNLFPTFGQESDLQLSESEAADTLTGLTVAFAVGRGLAILLIFKIPPELILVANGMFILAGNIILVGWGGSSIKFLWSSAILYGLGFSSFLPCFFAFMEKYMIFTDTIGALMVFSGSMVGAAYPLIVGGFIEDHPVVLSYPIFFSIGVCICSVSLSYVLTRGRTKRVNE